jgi:hypothetical protein
MRLTVPQEFTDRRRGPRRGSFDTKSTRVIAAIGPLGKIKRALVDCSGATARTEAPLR